MDLEKLQRGTAKLVSVAVVLAALALTYMGTALFCHEHGAEGWRGYTIAGINDLVVLLGIVWPERQIQAVAAFCAGFTVWANVSHAADGFAGFVVAFIAPGLAIGLIAALESVAHGSVSLVASEPVEPVSPAQAEPTHESEPEPLSRTERESMDEYVEFVERLNEPNSVRPRLVAAASVPDESELLPVPEGGWTKDAVLAKIAEKGWTTAQAVRYTGKPKATINRWKLAAKGSAE